MGQRLLKADAIILHYSVMETNEDGNGDGEDCPDKKIHKELLSAK